VIHTASILSFSPDPNKVIPPTIAGVTTLLYAASREPSVKSFVFTSSSVASAGGLLAPNRYFSIDASTWNDIAIKKAWSLDLLLHSPTAPAIVYAASKAEAEKALWKYVEEENPHFRVNTILPDVNLGEVLSLQGSLSTGAWIRTVYESGIDFVKTLPYGRFDCP
jgi:nucleoside-diphosphate-sugar epimerase